MQTQREKWLAVQDALAKVLVELDGVWPAPRRKFLRLPHMIGYSRGRGRRAVLERSSND